MKHILRAIMLAGLLVAGSACKADEPWTFAVTRHVWTEGFDREDVERAYRGGDPDDPMEELAICLLVCPIAIDIVLLPITLTHDFVIEDY